MLYDYMNSNRCVSEKDNTRTHIHTEVMFRFCVFSRSSHPGGYDGRSVPPYPFPQGTDQCNLVLSVTDVANVTKMHVDAYICTITICRYIFLFK